jgi:uncharacterized Zn finger protein
MSWQSDKSKAKRASAAQGIKVRKIGATWWGQRWIEALEHMSRDYLNRLGRGRAYARAGRVHDLHIAPGQVTAQVTGSDVEAYSVTLRVAMLSLASWKKVIATMGEQAVFSAELLAGHMPVEIDEAFRSAGHSLFLCKQRELETDCSCPDWANPCKHVAAVHYVLGEAFDKDPFLLFELRGRTKQQVLGALRAMRSGQSSDAQIEKMAADVADHATRVAPDSGIAIDTRLPSEYDCLAAALPALQFRIVAPVVPGAVLKQLGSPPSWPEPTAHSASDSSLDPWSGNGALALLIKQLSAGSQLAQDWALQISGNALHEQADSQ